MENSNLIFFLIIIIIWLLFVVLILFNRKPQKTENNSEAIKLLQDQIFNLNRTIDKKLWESNQNLNDSINKTFWITTNIAKESNKNIEELAKKVSEFWETNKQIKDIWWQLEWLEKILKNPKQRGILWEYFLESVLKNILPPENYSLQYKFKWENDNWKEMIADAVIFVKDKMIPIDSKFSLENYNKLLDSDSPIERENYEKEFRNDIKKRIDETSKYILPEQWTMDFAFMFIPSEWIYYDLLVNKVWTIKVNMSDLIEYAFKEKKVIIVSPTSFYAYLQTVLQWLKALQIEESVKDIQRQISKLWKHLNAYEEYFDKLWKSLWVTVSHYNESSKKLGLIDKDIYKITSWETWWKYEKNTLDKPDY